MSNAEYFAYKVVSNAEYFGKPMSGPLTFPTEEILENSKSLLVPILAIFGVGSICYYGYKGIKFAAKSINSIQSFQATPHQPNKNMK